MHPDKDRLVYLAEILRELDDVLGTKTGLTEREIRAVQNEIISVNIALRLIAYESDDTFNTLPPRNADA